MVARRGNQSRRQRKVGENVRARLSILLTRQAHDPDLAWATITDVEMSPDLKNAHVYFVATGQSDSTRLSQALARAASFLRREIGSSLELKHTPQLLFKHDDSFDKASRIDEILAQTRSERELDETEDTPERSLARLVSENDRILLCAHANPDGDAIGSLLGLSRVLELQGKNPAAYCPDGIPGTLAFLPGASEVVGDLGDERFELTILMDTASENLLPAGFPDESRRGTLIVIDHHMTHGDLGDVIIRRDVAAVGQLLFDLTRELVWPVDREAAQCFYTSIVADTGSFRYTSTTPATHRAAADLIALGADPWDSATALYESFPLQRQKLLGLVAETLKVSENGRYAELHCTPEMLERCGATKADLDGMVNMGRSVRGVEIAAMHRLEPAGHVKVSFRSKGSVDVSGLASRFGGGGHRNAAGATIGGKTLDEAREMVRAAAAEHLADPSSYK